MRENLDKEIRRSVRAASHKWSETALSDTSSDVEQELWYKILTEPSTRRILEDGTRDDRMAFLTRAAKSAYSEMSRADRAARDENMFSVESVKDVLKGNPATPLHQYVVDRALKELDKRKHSDYAEALHKRYVEGLIPVTDFEKNQQKFAHVALTTEANEVLRKMYEPPERYYDCSSTPFPVLGDGPGSKNAVYPETRKPKGGYNDPTADAAIALLYADPEERELLLEETPLVKIMKGKG